MFPEEHELLRRGMRVLIGPELLGNELYGMDDPGDYYDCLGREATITRVWDAHDYPTWYVDVEVENDDGYIEERTLIIEEIQCILDNPEDPIEEITSDDFDAILVFASDEEEMITAG